MNDDFWWKNLSPESSKRLLELVKLLLNKIEISGPNRLVLYQITGNELNTVGLLNLDDAVVFTRRLGTNLNIIEVLNTDLTTRYRYGELLELMPSDPNIKELNLSNDLVFKITSLEAGEKLTKVISDLSNIDSMPFPNGVNVMYTNKILYFKLDDGLMEPVDFSNAPKVRSLFECFWELRKNPSIDKKYSKLALVNMHKKLFKEALVESSISYLISNLRKLVKNKPHLTNRFSFIFDKNSNSYLVEIR